MTPRRSTAWLLLRYFGPNELTFLRNFNKIVVKVEFVLAVYLRFYKALQRVPPLSLVEKRAGQGRLGARQNLRKAVF